MNAVPGDRMPDDLLAAARKAAASAYAPYSETRVGAALLATDGKVYTGCNLEVINLAGSICAERGALACAVAAGARSFTAVAIVSDRVPECYPCGICREVLREFGNMAVIVEDSGGAVIVSDLADLIPHHFKE